MKIIFRLLFLPAVLLLSSCGSSSSAIEVGQTSLDREELNTWIIERGYNGEAPATLDTEVVAGVVQQFIEFEALVDLLVEHDVVPSQADLEEAESQLVGNGFEPDSPLLERLTTWQAALNLANQLGPGV